MAVLQTLPSCGQFIATLARALYAVRLIPASSPHTGDGFEPDRMSFLGHFAKALTGLDDGHAALFDMDHPFPSQHGRIATIDAAASPDGTSTRWSMQLPMVPASGPAQGADQLCVELNDHVDQCIDADASAFPSEQERQTHTIVVDSTIPPDQLSLEFRETRDVHSNSPDKPPGHEPHLIARGVPGAALSLPLLSQRHRVHESETPHADFPNYFQQYPTGPGGIRDSHHLGYFFHRIATVSTVAIPLTLVSKDVSGLCLRAMCVAKSAPRVSDRLGTAEELRWRNLAERTLHLTTTASSSPHLSISAPSTLFSVPQSDGAPPVQKQDFPREQGEASPTGAIKGGVLGLSGSVGFQPGPTGLQEVPLPSVLPVSIDHIIEVTLRGKGLDSEGFAAVLSFVPNCRHVSGTEDFAPLAMVLQPWATPQQAGDTVHLSFLFQVPPTFSCAPVEGATFLQNTGNRLLLHTPPAVEWVDMRVRLPPMAWFRAGLKHHSSIGLLTAAAGAMALFWSIVWGGKRSMSWPVLVPCAIVCVHFFAVSTGKSSLPWGFLEEQLKLHEVAPSEYVGVWSHIPVLCSIVRCFGCCRVTHCALCNGFSPARSCLVRFCCAHLLRCGPFSSP